MVDSSDEMNGQREIEKIQLAFTCATDLAEMWCSINTGLKEEDDGVICIGKYSGLQTTVPTEDLPASFSTVEGLGE